MIFLRNEPTLLPVWLILGLGLLFSQPTRAEISPQQRPALVGSGPKALVNLIDAEGLFRKGQRDAWVMFEGVIAGDTFVPSEFSTFSPNSEPLRAEVRKRLRQARFLPAIYKGRGAYAFFAGTVVYVVAGGRPHVRVYANQDLDEIKRGTDFIAPQPVAIPGQAGITGWPDDPSATFRTGGLVKLRHTVDANGKTTDVQVISESPSGQQAGEAAAKMARLLDYLPPYRNGHPVTSAFTETWTFGNIRRW